MNERPVIICTEHRGVFFGYAEDTSSKESVFLKSAKMAIRFGTTKGVMQLAHTGPTNESRISSPADITVNDITAVFEVSKDAEEVWKNA